MPVISAQEAEAGVVTSTTGKKKKKPKLSEKNLTYSASLYLKYQSILSNLDLKLK